MARILVIKLGALGDVVLAFAPFAAIRAHHAADQVTLLTTAPFAALCAASPWFDRVEIDSRPPVWDLPGLLALRRRLRGFDFAYDLQTSSRSSHYFRLAGRPAWSGIASGASHPHDNAERDLMHTRERQAEQLARAGIASVPHPDLGWLARGGPELTAPYALLVPGAAPHRPAKRWPATQFAQLAGVLDRRGLRPVVVGTDGDAPHAAAIRDACPQALDLTGRTSLLELGGLAARASLAIGNDTGPMHLAAAMGCRAIVLFSGESDPSLTAPRGPDAGRVQVVRADRLDLLSVARVAALLG
ncbi:glycosyltransferase family 9 protein [Lichenicoccus sp.]|uniref:glycosyltransferase family 9 protein n=1 Tax=Lichenicoccus sp. TaxID=2781899 RepID=UPI003D151DAE